VFFKLTFVVVFRLTAFGSAELVRYIDCIIMFNCIDIFCRLSADVGWCDADTGV